jgi:CHAT domain-containing protein
MSDTRSSDDRRRAADTHSLRKLLPTMPPVIAEHSSRLGFRITVVGSILGLVIVVAWHLRASHNTTHTVGHPLVAENIPRTRVIIPDRGEPRTERLSQVEQVILGLRQDSNRHPEALSAALISLAQVGVELERFAMAQRAIEEAIQLVPSVHAWQYREAQILAQTIRQCESGPSQERETFRDSTIHRIRALRLHAAGNYSEASDAARRAVTLDRRLSSKNSQDPSNVPCHGHLADSLLLLGKLAMEHGDTYQDAESILKEASSRCASVRGENHPAFAETLAALAWVADDRGHFDSANGLYERALEIYRRTLGELSVEYSRALSRQGRMHLNWWKDYAWGKCARAQQIREQILGTSHPDYAESLEDLALLAMNLSDFDRGESLANEAFSIRQTTQGIHHPQLAEALSLIALCNTERGNLAKALVNQRLAVQLCEQARKKVHPLTARYQMYLAQRCNTDFDFSRSYSMFDECIGSLRTLGLSENPIFAEALFSYADCIAWESVFFEQSDDTLLSDADVLLCELESIFDAAPGGTGLPAYPFALLVRVQIHYIENYRRASCDDAWKLFERAVENVALNGGEDHPVYGELFYTRGRLLTSRAEYDGAKLALEKFIEIEGKRFGKVRFSRYLRSLSALAGLYLHQGTDLARSGVLIRESLEMLTERFRANSPTQSDLTRLGLVSHFQYQLASLLSAESLEGPHEKLYEEVAGIQGVATEFQLPDRVAIDRRQLDPLMQRVRESRQRLKQLTYNPAAGGDRKAWFMALQEASQNKEDIENELALATSDVNQSETSFSLVELQAELPDGGAFVEYVKYLHHGPPPDHLGPLSREFRMVAFVVHKSGPPMTFSLGPARTIEAAVDRWREAIVVEQNGQVSDVQNAANAVANLIWKPLISDLDDASTVLIVPDGPLYFLSFAALPGRAVGTYLIEDHSIGYVSSARMACTLLQSQHSKLNSGMLAVGGIDYGDTGRVDRVERNSPEGKLPEGLLPADAHWARLPSTEQEAEVVLGVYSDHFGAEAKTKLLNGDVDVRTFVTELQQRWGFIHFAGHGYFAEEELPTIIGSVLSGRKVRNLGRREYYLQRNQNLLSGLVLANTNRTLDETVLTAEEVGGLDLRGTELVVLSACETGLGRTAGGIGVIGLKRALFTAGARTVVTSLWKVDDAATSVLMQQFYSNLFKKKLTKWDALREAQLYVLNHQEAVENYSDQLVARGIQAGKTRRLPADGSEANNARDLSHGTRSRRASPASWAAFGLYGDGR